MQRNRTVWSTQSNKNKWAEIVPEGAQPLDLPKILKDSIKYAQELKGNDV